MYKQEISASRFMELYLGVVLLSETESYFTHTHTHTYINTHTNTHT